jgi:xylan 1,4-beta-xylosidase
MASDNRDHHKNGLPRRRPPVRRVEMGLRVNQLLSEGHPVKLVYAAVAAALTVASPAAAQTRTIAADYSQVRGPHSAVWKMCVGAGRANEGLRADWQEQLALVQKEIGFRYIRMHGLLHDDMGVYREDAKGNAIYNWQYVDKLYDYLLSVGIKPFVELAFMPHDLASGDKTVFWWRGNITPPKSYEKWGALIANLVRHFRERYGDAEVRTWYFEVWNEPDLKNIFWSGDLDDYLKLYTAAAEAVKSVSPEYRVGGPASASPTRFEEELVKYCARTHVPIDFVSTHTYGVREGFFDDTGARGTVLDTSRGAVIDRMKHSRELILSSPLPNLQLHYTEWSSAYTPTDFMHDQYHQASFILDKIKGAQQWVDSLSYWVFTDIFEENGPRATPFHGGFGLLNYQGIRKPAYFAYQFLSRMGSAELADSDASSWVTKSEHGDVQALLWDYSPIAPPQGVNDQVFYKNELPAKPAGAARLDIANLPAGTWSLAVYRTGYRVNDAYTAYLDLGAPSQLTPAQVDAIQQQAGGAPVERSIVKHAGGTFTKDLPLHQNDVVLVVLNRL